MACSSVNCTLPIILVAFYQMYDIVNCDQKMKTNRANPVVFGKIVTSVEGTVRLFKPGPGCDDPNTTKPYATSTFTTILHKIRSLSTVLYTRLDFAPILSYVNSTHTLTPCFCTTHFNNRCDY